MDCERLLLPAAEHAAPQSAPEGVGGARWTFPWSKEWQCLAWLACLVGAALTEVLLFSCFGDPWSSLLKPRSPSQAWHFLNNFPGWKQHDKQGYKITAATPCAFLIWQLVTGGSCHFQQPSLQYFSAQILKFNSFLNIYMILRLYEAIVEVLKGVQLLWAQNPC